MIAYTGRLTSESITKGFVPTMGALHQGHISLVECSKKESEVTIVSVFVNSRQFNDMSDYNNYPSTLKSDSEILENAGCDVLFVPSHNDVYADFHGFEIDFHGLDKIYEGEFRPGHFQGVVDVVYRLFEIVRPENAYFGEKDFQQLAVIKTLEKQTDFNINIHACPIVRETNGLAMSSRNKRLNDSQIKEASNIYKLILEIKQKAIVGESCEEYISYFNEKISAIGGMKPEYAVFCEPESLKMVNNFEANTVIILCVAVWCGKVRLIDNISLAF